MLDKKNLLIILFILLGVFTRVIPHPPNFTALGAIALFGGAFFSNKYFAFLIPILIMFLSDLILGYQMVLSVYISFIIIVFLGFLLQKKQTGLQITGVSILASIIFFIVTNFFFWLNSSPLDGVYYCPKDIMGLVKSYTQAIPFFWNTLFSTLIYSLIVFFSFKSIQKQILVKLQ